MARTQLGLEHGLGAPLPPQSKNSALLHAFANRAPACSGPRHHGWMDRPLPIVRYIALYDGIATTAELLRGGFSPVEIRLWHDYRRILRVRKGLWANLDVRDDVVLAARVGGRLACVSALEHHGVVPPELVGRDIHVDLSRSASRLRSLRDRNVVLHWSRAERDGDRQAVSIEVALDQAQRCEARKAKMGTPPHRPPEK